MRQVVYLALAVLWLTHTDIWYWNDASIVLGLPIGVTYHVVWSLAVSVVFWLAVKYAWPDELETQIEAVANAGATGGAGSTPPAPAVGGIEDGDQ